MKQLTLLVLLGAWLLAGCQGDSATPTALPAAPSTGITAEPGTAVSSPTSPTPIPGSQSITPVTSISLFPVVTEGLDEPLYLTNAGDERLFVVEKGGTIRIVQDGRLLPEPFLDIRDRVNARSSERGLLSVAFHPDYAQNGRFFVNYTNRAGDTAVSAFQVTADPNRADAASEQNLLTVAQPFPNHNGGQLQFGPDGYLYAGMGDGGSGGDPQGNGQNPATLLGALLRLDVDQAANGAAYGIPADNPFTNDSSRRPEVWAFGLRNPWRFSFDRATDDLLLADVGQNQWEEVNFLPAGSQGGRNFGWNIMEGAHCYGSANCDQTGLTLPVYDYQHENGRCSVTGGYVYRGQQFPALTGNFFFADYCSGEIWSAVVGMETDGRWTANRVLSTPSRIASFGEDVHGELYVVDITSGIYQIRE
ncbi:MAG: PQQ-dependent sugar dehydrogenase [Ardenticatenaceae bacterium]|nr:PQQ-dependent sugar dehydrogenase [Ardenticatenaceae bacterium]